MINRSIRTILRTANLAFNSNRIFSKSSPFLGNKFLLSGRLVNPNRVLASKKNYTPTRYITTNKQSTFTDKQRELIDTLFKIVEGELIVLNGGPEDLPSSFNATDLNELKIIFNESPNMLKQCLGCSLNWNYMGHHVENVKFLMSFNPKINFSDSFWRECIIHTALMHRNYNQLLDLIWVDQDASWVTLETLELAAFYDDLGQTGRILYFMNRGAKIDLASVPACQQTIPLYEIDKSQEITAMLEKHITKDESGKYIAKGDLVDLDIKFFPRNHFIADYDIYKHFKDSSRRDNGWINTSSVLWIYHVSVTALIEYHNWWVKTQFNLKLGLEQSLANQNIIFNEEEKDNIRKIDKYCPYIPEDVFSRMKVK